MTEEERETLKRKFWSTKVKTILILALILAVLATVIGAVVSGTPFFSNVVGTILSPIRSGIAAIDRQAEQYYNYLFSYESLQARNAELEKRILEMQEDVRNAAALQRENEQLRLLLDLRGRARGLLARVGVYHLVERIELPQCLHHRQGHKFRP